MKAKRVSVDQAKPDKLFYVVANSVIYRSEDGRCLILKRDEREKVYPGKWASIGGKLEHKDLDLKNPSRVEGEVFKFNDSIERLLTREALEEAGVAIAKPSKFIGTKVIVREDGIPVVLLNFASRYAGGDVAPEEGGFTDFAWVNADEVEQYDCIEGVPEEIKAAIKILEEE